MAKSSLFPSSYRQKFKFFQKKTGFWLFCLSLSWLFHPIIAQADTSILDAKQLEEISLPEDELRSLTGQAFRFDAFKDKAGLVINFWATWCGPCVAELPELEDAAQKLMSDNIQVMLISVDRKGLDHAQNFLDEREIKTPLSFHSPMSEWPRQLGLRGLPSTLLVSADQSQIYVVQGAASWADEQILNEVVALLAP